MPDKPTEKELDELSADGDQVIEGVNPPSEKELKEAWDAVRDSGNS